MFYAFYTHIYSVYIIRKGPLVVYIIFYTHIYLYISILSHVIHIYINIIIAMHIDLNAYYLSVYIYTFIYTIMSSYIISDPIESCLLHVLLYIQMIQLLPLLVLLYTPSSMCGYILRYNGYIVYICHNFKILLLIVLMILYWCEPFPCC